MSWEVPGLQISVPANADLSANQYAVVSAVNSSGSAQAAITAAGAACTLGVLQNEPKAGEAATIMTAGVSLATVGGTGATAGDKLEVVGTAGAVQTRATGIAVGVALQTGAAGVRIAMLIRNQLV